mmetsp:Transcript_91970/g.281415  ORF Transcript_91970/g.281415 Transcript_91970/m.281415 type:complete len:366 (+) Transcript_91970:1287-2384(+)
MVFADEHRDPRELLVVHVQEQAPNVGGRVRRIHAVDEARLVRRPDVVLRVVAHRLGVHHRPPELLHLPERWHRAELAAAIAADAEGEGRGQRRGLASHAHLLLRVQHGVEGADHGLAIAAGAAGELQIRLVHQDDRPEGGVVDVPRGQEASLQVLHVLALHLPVAIEASGDAIPWHLRVRVIADATDHLQALEHRLVQEAHVVQRGVVAVQADGVRAQGLHDGQVPAAAVAPHRLGGARHEVVVGQPPLLPQRHGRVADALDEVLLGPCRGQALGVLDLGGAVAGLGPRRPNILGDVAVRLGLLPDFGGGLHAVDGEVRLAAAAPLRQQGLLRLANLAALLLGHLQELGIPRVDRHASAQPPVDE